MSTPRTELRERIRSSIRAAGMSDRQFAAAVDATPSSISAWFNLDRLPDAETLMRIPAALGVNGHWLLTGEGPRYLRAGEDDEHLLQRGRQEVLGDLEEWLRSRRASASSGDRDAAPSEAQTAAGAPAPRARDG